MFVGRDALRRRFLLCRCAWWRVRRRSVQPQLERKEGAPLHCGGLPRQRLHTPSPSPPPARYGKASSNQSRALARQMKVVTPGEEVG